MSEYSLFDSLQIVLENGKSDDNVRKYFDAELLPFGKNKSGKRRTITFREVEKLPESDSVVGSENRANLKFVGQTPKFELCGDRMYAKSYDGGRAAIPLKVRDELVIDYEKNTSPGFLFNSVFTPLLRRHLITENKVLLHASAAILDGEALVYCGWAHAGKTNGLLRCLEKGGKYLGDDKVIMDRQGKIHPYPLRLNLFGYNFDANPWLIKRAFSSMRFRWLSWWNRRAQSALRRPWNKGPLRGGWESIEYVTKTGLHNRYRPEDLEIPVADGPVPLGTFHVLAPLPKLELDGLARRLRSVNDEEDFLQKRMQPAADFLHGVAPLFQGGDDEEKLIADALAHAGKIAYRSP